jgi:hypothetical protein
MQVVIDAAMKRIKRLTDAAMAKFIEGSTASLAQQAAWSVAEQELIIASVQGALTESGMYEIAHEFGGAAKKFAIIARDVAPLGLAQGNMLAASVKAKYTGWADTVDRASLQWMKDRLAMQSVAPIPWRQLSQEFAENISGTLSQYAETYVETGLTQLSRDTWIAAGDAMGAEFYRWEGPPPIDSSHPECIENTGKVFTMADLKAMGDNKTGLPIWPTLGGFGCRHVPLPVPSPEG